MDAPGERRRLTFDPTINLGHILSISAVIATLIAGWTSLNARLESVERQVVQVAQLVIDGARTDERIRGLEHRVSGLEGSRSSP